MAHEVMYQKVKLMQELHTMGEYFLVKILHKLFCNKTGDAYVQHQLCTALSTKYCDTQETERKVGADTRLCRCKTNLN
jgi:hypothetical protein